MGLRFRRSIKIAPGVRLNVGSKSWGISTGVRGARISTNSKTGTHASVGIPGTGLSYRHKIGSAPKQTAQEDFSPGRAFGGCLVLIFAINPLLGCSGIILGILALCFVASLASSILASLLALGIKIMPTLITLGITIFVIIRNAGQAKSQITNFLDVALVVACGLISQLIYLWAFFMKK